MKVNEYRNFCWAAKHAIIDLVMFEHFDVPNRVGVSEMVENMRPSEVCSLAQLMMSVDDSTSSQILTEMYTENIQSENTGVHLMTESKFADKRYSVLTEAENDSKVTPKDLSEAIMLGSMPMALALFVRAMRHGGVEEAKTLMSGLLKYNEKAYNIFARQPIVRKILPGAATVKGGKVVAMAVNPADELISKLKKNAVKSRDVAQQIEDFSLKATANNIVKYGIKNKYRIIATIGVTGASVLAYTIYQKMFSPAAKSCNKYKGVEKTKCMLRYKIAAASTASDQLQQMMAGCDEHKNPQKCKFSIQRDMWNWNRRKQKYQSKLAKLDHIKASIYKKRQSYSI